MKKLIHSPTVSSPRIGSQGETTPSGATIFPISAVTTFSPRNWAFVGRCTSKSGIRTFTGKDGLTKRLASVDMIDSTGDIRLTFWTEVCPSFLRTVTLFFFFSLSCAAVHRK